MSAGLSLNEVCGQAALCARFACDFSLPRGSSECQRNAASVPYACLQSVWSLGLCLEPAATLLRDDRFENEGSNLLTAQTCNHI
jgi:hypothetical protein